MMRLSSIVIFLWAMASAPSLAQTFNDLPSYCRATSEASTPTLLARTQGIQRRPFIRMARWLARERTGLTIRSSRSIKSVACQLPPLNDSSRCRMTLSGRKKSAIVYPSSSS